MELDISQTARNIRSKAFDTIQKLVDGTITTAEANKISKEMGVANKAMKKEVIEANKAMKREVTERKKSVTIKSAKSVKAPTTNGWDDKGFKATKHTGLKEHKSGDKFLFDIIIEGKRYRKTYKDIGKNLSKKDKLAKAYNALETFTRDTIHANTITANIKATVNDYYYNLKQIKNWSEDSTNRYNNLYDKYIRDTLGKKIIRDVKPQHFTEFNKTITHLSKSRQKMNYEILSPLFNLAIEDELIIKSPIKRTHVPKRDQQSEKKVILNAVDKYRNIHQTLYQLFNSTDTIVYPGVKEFYGKVNKPYLALFLFGFHGRRLNEVVTLQWDDIDFINNQYRIKKEISKIKQDMIYTLPLEIKELLETFKDVSGNVFTVRDVRLHYKHIRNISGIQEFTFHWMRNLSVSALSASGIPTIELSAMLGHSDINTLNKYLSLQRTSATANTANASQKLLS